MLLRAAPSATPGPPSLGGCAPRRSCCPSLCWTWHRCTSSPLLQCTVNTHKPSAQSCFARATPKQRCAPPRGMRRGAKRGRRQLDDSPSGAPDRDSAPGVAPIRGRKGNTTRLHRQPCSVQRNIDASTSREYKHWEPFRVPVAVPSGPEASAVAPRTQHGSTPKLVLRFFPRAKVRVLGSRPRLRRTFRRRAPESRCVADCGHHRRIMPHPSSEADAPTNFDRSSCRRSTESVVSNRGSAGFCAVAISQGGGGCVE